MDVCAIVRLVACWISRFHNKQSGDYEHITLGRHSSMLLIESLIVSIRSHITEMEYLCDFDTEKEHFHPLGIGVTASSSVNYT